MPKRRIKFIKKTFDPGKSAERIGRTCTRKRRYTSADEAQFQADVRFINYYECAFCGGYHLTSRGIEK